MPSRVVGRAAPVGIRHTHRPDSPRPFPSVASRSGRTPSRSFARRTVAHDNPAASACAWTSFAGRGPPLSTPSRKSAASSGARDRLVAPNEARRQNVGPLPDQPLFDPEGQADAEPRQIIMHRHEQAPSFVLRVFGDHEAGADGRDERARTRDAVEGRAGARLVPIRHRDHRDAAARSISAISPSTPRTSLFRWVSTRPK